MRFITFLYKRNQIKLIVKKQRLNCIKYGTDCWKVCFIMPSTAYDALRTIYAKKNYYFFSTKNLSLYDILVSWSSYDSYASIKRTGKKF